MQHNEVGLFELIKIFWDGKWIVGISIMIAVMVGSGFMLSKNPRFESSIFFSLDLLSPIYDEKKTFIDFESNFFSPSVFRSWRQRYGDDALTFEKLDQSKIFGGIKFLKSENDRLVTIVDVKEKQARLKIKSDQPVLLNSVLEYATYVGKVVKREYIVQSKNDIHALKKVNYNALGVESFALTQSLLAHNRFIGKIESGSELFVFQPPTIPKRVSLGFFPFLGMSFMLGSVIGGFLVIARHWFRVQKDRVKCE